jgi:hypothetical protein
MLSASFRHGITTETATESGAEKLRGSERAFTATIED